MTPESKDLILLAFPEKSIVSIDAKTEDGMKFLSQSFDSVKEQTIDHSIVNDILGQIRHIGLSYSFRLG